MKLKVKIYGKEVEINPGDYVVEEWWSGSWHPMATYPNTKQGYADAVRKMQVCECEYGVDVRLQQYF